MAGTISRSLRCVLALTLMLVGACRSGPNWKYNNQVEGTVKLDGVAVPNVLVRFVPDDPKVQGPASGGYTDEQGHFTLTCENKKAGAIIGKHKVLIMSGRGDPDSKPGKTSGTKTLIIPTVYSNPINTPLEMEVTADRHTYDLNLSRNPTKR
jgi:hypothetical protein